MKGYMAKKKAAKKGVKKAHQTRVPVTVHYQILFVQSMLLALIGAAAVYSVIEMAQLRDQVDEQYMQVLGASTQKADLKR